MATLSLKSKIFHGIHLFGLLGVSVGLPFNKIVLSIALMLLLANLLVQAKFKTYWENLKGNKLVWLLIGFWLLHLLGLLWTTEIDFAMRDIRVKLPLVILPLVLGAQPITIKEQKALLLIFVSMTAAISIVNYFTYFQYFGPKEYTDVRGMSLFGSHIRYGIMVGFSAAIALYYVNVKSKFSWILLPVFLWLCYYTYVSEILSGLIALLIGIMCVIFPPFIKKWKLLGRVSFAAIIIVPVSFLIMLLVKPQTEEFDINSAPKMTAEGNPYKHELNQFRDVYGNYIFTYWCEVELKREWNKVSNFDYDGIDKREQVLRFTLLRYMASKKLKKDALGFRQLSKEDIKNVENGITEDPKLFKGVWNRLNGIRYQIYYSSDPNGHSLLQRLEFWKAGWQIAKQNWLIGVGTGDTQVAFDQQYEKMKSKLDKEHRMRTHNTYLTHWITFGVFSLLFLFLLLHFTKTTLCKKDYLGLAFILISIATFFIEDTLETQAGVTFFAYFYALFGVKNQSHSPFTSHD